MKIENILDFIDEFVTRRLRIGEPWSDRLIFLIFSIVCILVIVSVIFVLYFPGKHVVSLITRVPGDKKIFQDSIDLFTKGDYKGSIGKSEQLIKDFPNSDYVDEALFNIGKAHHNREKYDDARAAYIKFMDKFPKSEYKNGVHRQINKLFLDEAQALFKEKKYEQAYQNFNRLLISEDLKEYPALEAEAMKHTISCLLWLNKSDDAIKLCNNLITKFPGSTEAASAWNTIGILKYYEKDYEQSLSAFRKSLDQNVAPVGILLSFSKLNKYDEVQDYVKDFSEQFPDNQRQILESYVKKGLKHASYALREVPWARAKVYEQARTEFENILKGLEDGFDFLDLKEDVKFRIAQLYFDEGKDYYERGSYKASRETLDKLIQQFPDSDLKGEARRLSAQSYFNEEKYNQAFINFDTLTGTEFDGFVQIQAEAMYKAAYSLKSLSIDDEDLYHHEILSKAISDEALARYTEFLTRFPDNKYVSDAYFDQGKIYAAQKKYELALNRYKDALRNTKIPTHRAEIQLDIGSTYQELSSDKKAVKAFEEAVNAAEEAIKEKEDIENAKLSRARAMYLIVGIHIQRKEWDMVRDIYNNFIEAYGEAGYEVTTSEFGEPIKTDFMAICAYWIGEAYHEMKDSGKALEWYEKIVKEKGFQTDDSVPEILKEKDFRTDALAPHVLHRALLVRNKLEGAEKLEGIANKYINDIRDDKRLLSAKARFNFAKMKREVFQDYKGAAKEFAKLATYRGSDPSLNLIKLQGKYYEGHCYKKLASSQDADEAYTTAIMLFNLNFQRLIDAPHIKPPNISEKVFDYWIQTALEYVERACAEIKDTEYAKKACPKIKEARQKLEDKDKAMQKSDASNNSNPSETSQTKGQLTAQEIAQKASNSTVFITMEGIVEYESGQVIGVEGWGSGFFVKPNQIATNYHVISPKRKTYNTDDDKNEMVSSHPLRGTARLVGTDREYGIIGYTAIDPDQDLAILKVRAFGVEPLRLGNSENLEVNDDIYAVGNPLGMAYLEGTVSYGKISGLRTDSTRRWIQITAPITHGNSGGPVLNKKGEVIGVSTGIILDEAIMEYKVKDNKGQEIGSVKLPRRREQNLNYVVPVNYLKALLERVGTPKPLSDLEIIY